MAFPDLTWNHVGELSFTENTYPEKLKAEWRTNSLLRQCYGERKKLKSPAFDFGDASWNFFAWFDQCKGKSLFGINVRERRPSNTILDCYCNIKFYLNMKELKNITLKFKYENADSSCLVEDFLSQLDLNICLLQGIHIVFFLAVKKFAMNEWYNVKEACEEAESFDYNSLSSGIVQIYNHLFRNHSITFPDLYWNEVGNLSMDDVTSPGTWSGRWSTYRLRKQYCGELKELRSPGLGFFDSSWNFFAWFDRSSGYSFFGINLREGEPSDTILDFYCDIKFYFNNYEFKNIIFKFKSKAPNRHCLVEDFLSESELDECLLQGMNIVFSLTVKKLSIEEVCQRAEIPHSSSSTVVPHIQTQQLKNEVMASPKLSAVNNMCHDLKQFLLSEEGSDVTLQVQDQQFKAHRFILMARSSVFAAMFRHDTKEKATGVVNVKDCEPSSFPILLEFMYCCSVEKLSAENVFHLYTSSDKYDVQDLKLECLEFIKKNLSIETFCETVRLALQHPDTNLLDMTVEFFAKNMTEIIVTVKWQAFITENPTESNEMFLKASTYWQLKPEKN